MDISSIYKGLFGIKGTEFNWVKVEVYNSAKVRGVILWASKSLQTFLVKLWAACDDKRAMNPSKHRLLICSPNPDFLKSSKKNFERHFEIQNANSEQMAIFLMNEWEPNFCFIESDKFSPVGLKAIGGKALEASVALFVFARPSAEAEIRAFQSGADYFCPIDANPKQIEWRVKSYIRRLQRKSGNDIAVQSTLQNESNKDEKNCIYLGDLCIYPNDYLIHRNSELVVATPTQFRLLLAFLTNSDQLLSRTWLREQVWQGAGISPRSIDAQISKLKKLVPEIDNCLINVYGKGYVFSKSKADAA